MRIYGQKCLYKRFSHKQIGYIIAKYDDNVIIVRPEGRTYDLDFEERVPNESLVIKFVSDIYKPFSKFLKGKKYEFSWGIHINDISFEGKYYPNTKIFRELYPEAEIKGDKLFVVETYKNCEVWK